MSDSVPSARLSRNMFGHFGSPTIRGSSLGALRLSVTFCSFCPSATPIDAVTLRTASGATPGRVAGTLTGIPRSRARCVAFRHRGLQKRAVERRGLNCRPQAEQAMLMMPPRERSRRQPRYSSLSWWQAPLGLSTRVDDPRPREGLGYRRAYFGKAKGPHGWRARGRIIHDDFLLIAELQMRDQGSYFVHVFRA